MMAWDKSQPQTFMVFAMQNDSALRTARASKHDLSSWTKHTATLQ